MIFEVEYPRGGGTVSTEPDVMQGEDEAADLEPSRTEKTRAAALVNKLGIALVALSREELDQLELPSRVREEIDVSKGLKAKSRGRQNRLIGQLLRAEDHDAIRERLAELGRARALGVQYEKVTEEWRTRIVDEGNDAVEALLEAHPSSDAPAQRQQLRQLARSVRQDPEGSRGRRARRELLRAIREVRS